jgi:hypothetical protein
LRHNNRFMWLNRERPSSGAAAAMGQSNAPAERISISTFGRSRAPLHDLVLEARTLFIERDKSRTVVFAAGRDSVVF